MPYLMSQSSSSPAEPHSRHGNKYLTLVLLLLLVAGMFIGTMTHLFF